MNRVLAMDVWTPIIALAAVVAVLVTLVPASVKVFMTRHEKKMGLEDEVMALRRAIVGEGDDGMNDPVVGLRGRVANLETGMSNIRLNMATKGDIESLRDLVKANGNGHS